MNTRSLEARLFSAAELVRQGAVFADVGTDHAYLPIFLLKEGRISRAFCTDINAGPLASARKNCEESGCLDRTSFLLTDGASTLAGHGITDYAICGMGGELIADIVERAEHLKNPEISLVLQPMSKQERLRAYLAASGFEILTESYSYDAGKYYVCFLAKYTGVCREIDDAEAVLGSKNAEYVNKDAQIGYIEQKINSLTRAMNGKSRGGECDGSEAGIIAAAGERLLALRG